MSGDGEYNFSLTTFSPSGKLVQIENALAGVSRGAPTLGMFAWLWHSIEAISYNKAAYNCLIGIKAKNGVVIASERATLSPLVEADSIYKIDHFTKNIGVVAAGMPADFRIVLKKGRKEVCFAVGAIHIDFICNA